MVRIVTEGRIEPAEATEDRKLTTLNLWITISTAHSITTRNLNIYDYSKAKQKGLCHFVKTIIWFRLARVVLFGHVESGCRYL